MMLTGELQPEAPLHRGDEFDPGVATQDALDEGEVGEVVFDVQDPPSPRQLNSGSSATSRPASVAVLATRTVGRRELDDERASRAGLALGRDRPAHRLDQPL